MIILINNRKKDLTFDEMDTKFQKLIYKLVWNFSNVKNFDFNEYYQIGYVGYLKARKTYKINKKNNFSNYMSTVIKNEICMSIRKKDPIFEDIENYNNIHEDFNFDNIDNKIYINSILLKLNEKDLDLIKLYYFKNLGHKEIGALLNKSTSCICRKKLRILNKIKMGVSHEY